jgi:hypothetical protein
MALTVLAAIIRRRLPTIPIESIVDSIGPAVHRDHNAIRRNRGTGIKVGRSVIMEVHVIGANVPVMAMVDLHIRGE